MKTREVLDLTYQVLDLLADSGGEATEEVDAMLEQLAGERDAKLEALWHVRQRLRTERAHAADMEKRRKAEKKRCDTALDRIEALTVSLMESLEATTGERSHRGDGFKVTLTNSERVQVTEPRQLAEFDPSLCPLEPKPDKRAIKAALEDGRDLPGCWIEGRVGLRWS